MIDGAWVICIMRRFVHAILTLTMIIKMKKFILRPHRLSDVPSLAKNINDPSNVRFTQHIPYPYKRHHAVSWVRKQMRERRKKRPSFIQWAIVIDNEVVGGIGINKIIYGHKAEIGYWLAREHRRQGVMKRAVKEIVRYAFTRLGLRRIFAFTLTNNLASQKVLLRNGFLTEGRHRKNVLKDGAFKDTYVFGKVR
ncbi:MAG TPA: GNAT family N-acetyltransferase [Candidatus Kerfeldbacteria bacterium]|nr:MAG: Acetyltransferase [Parcubacteria group bacterium GW2011_GWA2_48_9]HCM68171.1 GNAT family N-acetyltransferase [Candidatus Kerfeldbacteria bacterium]